MVTFYPARYPNTGKQPGSWITIHAHFFLHFLLSVCRCKAFCAIRMRNRKVFTLNFHRNKDAFHLHMWLQTIRMKVNLISAQPLLLPPLALNAEIVTEKRKIKHILLASLSHFTYANKWRNDSTSLDKSQCLFSAMLPTNCDLLWCNYSIYIGCWYTLFDSAKNTFENTKYSLIVVAFVRIELFVC